MTTRTNPADDIIELTDIVEEGIALEKDFDDFAMDKAVDAKSLDQELDDLLRDAVTAPKPVRKDEDDIDLDMLFTGANDTPVQTRSADPGGAQSSAPEMDLSDLDDLFDSLHIGEMDEEPTALDVILDDFPQPSAHTATETSAAETIDLDLELPGMGADDMDSNIHDLTEELLADIPETVLVQTPSAREAASATSAMLPTPEDLELELTGQLFATPAKAAQPEAPVASQKEPEPYSSSMETPVAQTVVEEKFSPVELEMLSARLDALEARPEPLLDIRPEQILDLLPQSPQGLPLAEALREDILQSVENKLAGLNLPADLETLRQLLGDATDRIGALEARPEPTLDIRPEQILDLLPQSPQGLPLAEALREDILEHVESKISDLASSASVDGLQQSVNALQSQVDSMPDLQAALAAASPSSASQDMENELTTLRTMVQHQAEILSSLQEALADKDSTIASLRTNEVRLRNDLDDLASRVNSTPPVDALKSELSEYIQQQVPGAAARIVRAEIQALLREIGG